MKAVSSIRALLSRRKFLDLGLKAALASQIPLFSEKSNWPDRQASRTVRGACYHDCPDTCSWTVTSSDNRIISFEASESNPYTNGQLCEKMADFPSHVTFHPERVLTPMKRTGPKGSGAFEAVSWEDAIRDVAQRTKKLIRENGSESILPYSFAGTEGLIQKNLISARFFARIGASRLQRTICGDAAVTGVLATNGQTTGVLPADIVHSRYIILWGTNTINTNQHLWPFIQHARSQGAKVVVIDPFRSDTARKADWHIKPKPGTDTVLALGLIHMIIREGLQDADYIEKYTSGFDELKAHVEPYDLKETSRITGIDPLTIQTLAREYASGDPALIRILIGMEHQANGASAFRTVAMLPALTGAWRKQGGGLMHMTYELFGEALNWAPYDMIERIDPVERRSVNMIQIGRALTTADASERIHGLFVYNSNPAVIAPDQNQVLKGLARDDLFTVVLEHFMTDTAQYADYVFPATTQLEHWDLMTSWGQPYLNINEPAIPPVGDSKSNTEIFRLLSREMGFTDDYLFESDLELIRQLLDSSHPYMEGITFDSLREKGWARLALPDPWVPHINGNFGTASGKCLFYNPEADPPLPEYTPSGESAQTAFPIQLLTVKSPRLFLNTCHANVAEFIEKEGPPILTIHPGDAEFRQINEGDKVRIFNDRGEVYLAAHLENSVTRGVACMPQGYWRAQLTGGSTANSLTTDLLTDKGEGAAFHETWVEIEKA